jgi:hypothetical protein
MKSTQNKWFTSILFPFFLMMVAGGFSFCQNSPDAGMKQQQKATTLTADQVATIKTILSKYDASRLTAADAKSIHEKFRTAGIHAGPETRDVIKAAGFDPDKLRDLDPPRGENAGGNHPSRSAEDRLKEVESEIIKPLSLTPVQQNAVMKAYQDFFSEVEKLKAAQGSTAGPVDRSKIEPVKVKRDDAIRKALPADKYSKYQELEKANHPGKSGGSQPGPKQQ